MFKVVLLSAVCAVLLTPMVARADAVQLDITDEAGNKVMGDPVHGEVVFHKCMVCHTIKDENHIGPSLHGVVNRPAGTIEGFAYSPANKNSGIVWSEQKLFSYLQHPQQVVPGTKMTFPGLPSATDRADVIAFLAANPK